MSIDQKPAPLDLALLKTLRGDAEAADTLRVSKADVRLKGMTVHFVHKPIRSVGAGNFEWLTALVIVGPTLLDELAEARAELSSLRAEVEALRRVRDAAREYREKVDAVNEIMRPHKHLGDEFDAMTTSRAALDAALGAA